MVTRPRTARAGKRKAKGEAKAAADKESQEVSLPFDFLEISPD